MNKSLKSKDGHICRSVSFELLFVYWITPSLLQLCVSGVDVFQLV